MPEQLTFYRDSNKFSVFAHRVEIALLETGASYREHGVNLRDKPDWYVQSVNTVTGKVPAITYGGPIVPPDEPSPLSFKLTESCVILEFLADVYPNSGLLPPVSNPTARARVRLIIDIITRSVEAPLIEVSFQAVAGALERLVAGLEKVQSLLPDPDAIDGGEYAIGKDFTNADCVMVSILTILEVIARTDIAGPASEPGVGKKLREVLAGDEFARLRRYKKALSARESVKKVVDVDHMETQWKIRFGGN